MSLTIAMGFTRRSWNVAPLPGYPAGLWVAASSSEGDASGGQLVFQHIFASPSAGLGDQNFYNIEQINVSTDVNAGDDVDLQITDMDPVSLAPFTDTNVSLFYNLPISAGQVNAGIQPLQGLTVPIWVGRFAGPPTATGLMNLHFANPTASNTARAKVQGYFWEAEAMNAPGGIRRPVDGIYG